MALSAEGGKEGGRRRRQTPTRKTFPGSVYGLLPCKTLVSSDCTPIMLETPSFRRIEFLPKTWKVGTIHLCVGEVGLGSLCIISLILTSLPPCTALSSDYVRNLLFLSRGTVIILHSQAKCIPAARYYNNTFTLTSLINRGDKKKASISCAYL